MSSALLKDRTWPYVDGLEDWLKSATYGLCADAIERIWCEVVAHCKDSLESKVALGSTLEEANREVMAELGTPREARRAFFRNHLTAWEAKLESAIRGGLGVPIVFAFLFLFDRVVDLFLPDATPMDEHLLASLIVAGFALPYWLGPFLMRTLKAPSVHTVTRYLAGMQCLIFSGLFIHFSVRIGKEIYSQGSTSLPLQPIYVLVSYFFIGMNLFFPLGYAFLVTRPTLNLARKLTTIEEPKQP